MPFNGSGVFQRVYNWVNDANNNIKIRADRMDTETDDIATGLSTCITKDGQTTVTANLPMSGFKHTGVGNSNARNQYAATGQIQDQSFTWCGTAGGTANALTLSPSPAITAYAAGQSFVFKAGASPSTTTGTVAISGLSTIAIQFAGAALSGGEIQANQFYRITLDTASTCQLEGIAAQVAPFIDSTAIIKGSSDATKLFRIEVDGFTTGNTRVMTPPDADFTAVGLATTQTLTNKKLSDSTCTIVDDGDNTKQVAFQCSGVTTGTTRTLTVQDANGTLALTSGVKFSLEFTSTDQTITSAGALTLAHSLGVAPKFVEFFLVCQTNEEGYTAGMVVDIGKASNTCAQTIGAAAKWHISVSDATNVNVRFGSATNVYEIHNFTTGVLATLTNANWKLRVKAWA